MKSLSPHALVDTMECHHRVRLQRTPGVQGSTSGDMQLVAALGLAHEDRVLAHLEGVLERPLSRPGVTVTEADGVLVDSYQPHLASPDGVLGGVPDFLLGPEGLKALGVADVEGVVLEPVDAKLARSSRSSALLQVAAYGEMLARMGFPRPRRAHLVLAREDGAREFSVETHSLVPIYPMVERLVAENRSLLPLEPVDRSWAEPVPACVTCPFLSVCEAGRKEDRDLSLLAGLRPREREVLRGVDVIDLAGLAGLAKPVPQLSKDTLLRLQAQARLRLDVLDGSPLTALWASPECGFPDGPTTLRRPPERVEGLRPRGVGLGLPELDPHDVFFDFEGYPHHPRGGLEYLFGWTHLVDGEMVFDYHWCDTEDAERDAFVAFVDMLEKRFEEHPDAHLYHYAPYERTALRRLAQKYSTHADAVERLLAAERFVDLYAVVQGAFLTGAGSYSIKKLEPLYMPVGRSGEVQTAVGSIEEYALYVDELVSDPAAAAQRKTSILDYNRFDCESTLFLARWLDEHRLEALASGLGEWVAPPQVEASEESSARKEEVRRLEGVLAVPVPGAAPERAAYRSALADLVDYYGREENVYWGDVLRKYTLPDSDLDADDDVAVVASVGKVVAKPRARTNSYVQVRLSRPTRLAGQLIVHGGQLLKGVKTVTWESVKTVDPSVDYEPGVLWLEANPADLRGVSGRILLHPGNVSPGAKRDVLHLLAAREEAGGEPPAAGCAVAARSGTRSEGLATGPVTDAALASVLGLAEGSYVAVQGPPGAGKTYLASNVIVEATAKPWTLGVCCVAWKAVENVLEAAGRRGVDTVRHDAKAKRRAPGSDLLSVTAWADGLKGDGTDPVLGGTAFTYASLAKRVLSGEAEPLDVLVVDEASQMPLADLLAIAPAARRLVLLGDPAQLPHVSQGVHEGVATMSVLSYLLEDQSVLPSRHGFFLDETRRFPSGVSELVSSIAYDGRLHSHPSTEKNNVGGVSGVRFVGVESLNHATSNPDEADALVRVVRSLVGRPYQRGEAMGTLDASDVIVVAPYNDQVRLLERRMLREGLPVRVGTVDRFQGQEALVSVYSLTASSASSAARGIEFVLDTARVNVAVSRAQALAVVIGSPLLAMGGTNSIQALYSMARATQLLSLPTLETLDE